MTTAAEQEIRDVFDRYATAVRDFGAEALNALYAGDMHVFDSFVAWEYRGSAWRDNIDAWLGMTGTSQGCAFDNVEISVTGNLAVAHADVQYSSESGDRSDSMWNRMTSVLRKIDGAWKITHEHTSAPINDQSMQPVFERSG